MAIASKFVLRLDGKHIATGKLRHLSSIAHGYGVDLTRTVGRPHWAAFLFVCLVCLVLSRTKRTDVANTFLVTYIAILLGHAFYLGDPLSIPLKQMQSEALFTFFMITDPKTTQTGAAPGCCLPSESIAPAVVFLASDESSWITGAAIPLDGGLSAY